MNRRIKGQIFPYARDPEPLGWRVLSSVLVFILALAIATLLSIDDIEGERRGTTEVIR